MSECGKTWRVPHPTGSVVIRCERTEGHTGRCFGWTPQVKTGHGLLAMEGEDGLGRKVGETGRPPTGGKEEEG